MHVLPVLWLEVTFSASRALVAVRIVASERARNRKRWDFGISSIVHIYIGTCPWIEKLIAYVLWSGQTRSASARKLNFHNGMAGCLSTVACASGGTTCSHACGRQRTGLALATHISSPFWIEYLAYAMQ
jgi:hypothetical protein